MYERKQQKFLLNIYEHICAIIITQNPSMRKRLLFHMPISQKKKLRHQRLNDLPRISEPGNARDRNQRTGNLTPKYLDCRVSKRCISVMVSELL